MKNKDIDDFRIHNHDNNTTIYIVDLENQTIPEGMVELREYIVNRHKYLQDSGSKSDIPTVIKNNMVNMATYSNSHKDVIVADNKILVQMEGIIYKAILKHIANRFKDVSIINIAVHIYELLDGEGYYEICESTIFQSSSLSELILHLEIIKKFNETLLFIRCIHGIDYKLYINGIELIYDDNRVINYATIDDFLKDFMY